MRLESLNFRKHSNLFIYLKIKIQIVGGTKIKENLLLPNAIAFIIYKGINSVKYKNNLFILLLLFQYNIIAHQKTITKRHNVLLLALIKVTIFHCNFIMKQKEMEWEIVFNKVIVILKFLVSCMNTMEKQFVFFCPFFGYV